jgi:hypothetical protein
MPSVRVMQTGIRVVHSSIQLRTVYPCTSGQAQVTAACLNASAYCAGDKWPARSGETADWAGPDILFVGFEEVNPLNAISVVAGAGRENIEAWNTCIDCALNCKELPAVYTAAQARPHSLNCVQP